MSDVFEKSSVSTALAHRIVAAADTWRDGVSGGHYSQDMEVAQAGVAVLG